MFELSVALKYLRPRWRQLSVSIISMISIMVIALVVWLIVVFFSVTNGLEKNWIQKLIALTAPIRIVPTQDYYHSYYYQIDSVSQESNYTPKTIAEKLESPQTNPYDPLSDEETPSSWPQADLQDDGALKDLVKLAFQGIHDAKDFPGLTASDYEMTFSTLRMRLVRGNADNSTLTQSFLSQTSYLGSLDEENPTLIRAMSAPTASDLNNMVRMLEIGSHNIQEDSPGEVFHTDPESLRAGVKNIFDKLRIQQLKTPIEGWRLSPTLLPDSVTLKVFESSKNGRVLKVIIPADPKSLRYQSLHEEDGKTVSPATLIIKDKKIFLKRTNEEDAQPYPGPLFSEGNLLMKAMLIPASLSNAKYPDQVRFEVNFALQNTNIKGIVPLRGLEIAEASLIDTFDSAPAASPPWLYKIKFPDGTFSLALPTDSLNGEGVLLPKTFRDAGVLMGDRGYLSYHTPTASTVQEQRVPIFVAGFYDPGIIPIGGKYVLGSKQLTSMIRSSQNQEDLTLSNGINIRFDDLDQADAVKRSLQNNFEKLGISRYWRIETFREFEFTKDLLQQLKSDKNLFTLISTVIIIVACSNIISMLIILVNDKKIEIGILRSMGASALSIAAVFGICGVIMGVMGSLIGTFAAILTLRNLDLLVKFMSYLQGYDAFNPMFYGETLPNEVSFEALAFVVAMTGLISLLAGIVPAAKASMLRPSAILRAE